MKRRAQRTFVFVVAVAVILIGGCGGQNALSVKKSRAIAAENIELRKQLEQRSEEIEKLKARHGDEIKKQQNLLEECEREKQTWKTKAQQNIRDQVKGVLDVVVEENARLREENQELKTLIEDLQKQLEQGRDANK